MIRDFETSARHEEQLKKIKKKHLAESKKYQETIKHMKELREETYERKNEELKKKLKRKEKLFMNVIGKGRLSHQINKTSNNLNAYLQNIVTKKTIDIDDIKYNYKKVNKKGKLEKKK